MSQRVRDVERARRLARVLLSDVVAYAGEQVRIGLEKDDLFERLRPFIAQTPYAEADAGLLQNITSAVQNRLVTLQDIAERLPLFLEETPELANPEVIELLRQEDSQTVLEAFVRHAEAADELSGETLPQVAKAVQQETGLKGRALWLPLRGAITQELQGPDLPIVVGIFGKDKCLQLLRHALGY